MKKITAYEVGGEIYKNKKEAEKEEVRHKMILERSRLNLQLQDICKKLGIDVPSCAAQISPTITSPKHKFKKGDRVRVISSGEFAGKEGTILEEDLVGFVVRLDKSPTDNTCVHKNREQLFFERNLEKIDQIYALKKDTEPKFKKGDRVIVTGKNHHDLYGKEGIVRDVYPSPWHNGFDSVKVIIDDEDDPHTFRNDDLMKVKDSPNPKFKVGDKIRMRHGLDYNIWSFDPSDMVGEITEAHGEEHYQVKLQNCSRGKTVYNIGACATYFDHLENDVKQKFEETLFYGGDEVRISVPYMSRTIMPKTGFVLNRGEDKSYAVLDKDNKLIGRIQGSFLTLIRRGPFAPPGDSRKEAKDRKPAEKTKKK